LLLIGVLAGLNIRDSYYTYREKCKLEALKNIMEGLAEGLYLLFIGVLAGLNIRDS
jgi:hypothetical protein